MIVYFASRHLLFYFLCIWLILNPDAVRVGFMSWNWLLLCSCDFHESDIGCFFAWPVLAQVFLDAKAEAQIELLFQFQRSIWQVGPAATKGEQLRSHAISIQVIEVEENLIACLVFVQKTIAFRLQIKLEML